MTAFYYPLHSLPELLLRLFLLSNRVIHELIFNTHTSLCLITSLILSLLVPLCECLNRFTKREAS